MFIIDDKFTHLLKFCYPAFLNKAHFMFYVYKKWINLVIVRFLF